MVDNSTWRRRTGGTTGLLELLDEREVVEHLVDLLDAVKPSPRNQRWHERLGLVGAVEAEVPNVQSSNSWRP